MNTFYGGGGVESRHAAADGYSGKPESIRDRRLTPVWQRSSRSSALPASTLYGSHPGKSPLSPNGSGGCQLSARYAAEQAAPDPDYFTTHTYAELAGGF